MQLLGSGEICIGQKFELVNSARYLTNAVFCLFTSSQQMSFLAKIQNRTIKKFGMEILLLSKFLIM